MMTEQEWLAYLDKLTALEQLTGEQVAEVLGALLERLNTIIIGHVNRSHDDTQALARRLDIAREAIADLRTIVADLHTRMAALEGIEREAAGNGG